MAKEAEATETKEVAKPEQQIKQYQEKIRELQTQVNELISQHAPEYAQMAFQLRMARQLIASNAFPNITPEQAFVLLQAGKEMGLQPMESIKKLYIVNGRVGYHSDGLVSRLTEKGCDITYTDETNSGVTVTVVYGDKIYIEKVTDQDQILLKSKAMTFAKKNKMRFHGVRMIANFYLPHLVGSVTVWDQDDFEATKEEKKGEEFESIRDMIENSDSQEMLDDVFATNKKAITKSLGLTMLVGKKKKEFITLKQNP
jgi:hypothetical protein